MSLLTDQLRLKKHFGASEALRADSHKVSINKLIGLLFLRAFGAKLHLSVEVKGHIGELLFHIAHDLALCRSREGVSTLKQNFHEIVGQIASSKIKTMNGVRKSISLVDWYCMGDAISRIQNNTSCSARRIQRQHGLDGDKHRWRMKSFEHDLGHTL